MKNNFMEKIENWFLGDEDDYLIFLAKLSLLSFLLMTLIITIPVWILPYLIYKNSKHPKT